MILARLALESDEDDVIKLARQNVAETLPHHLKHFNAEVARATFRRYLTTANPTIFVVESRREIVGLLVAMSYEYAFRLGHFAGQEVIYVRPDMRGTRAAASLIQAYNQWIDRTKPAEAFLGQANGLNIERTSKFLKRFGYDLVGVTLRRILRS